jgi:hypothetical protein
VHLCNIELFCFDISTSSASNIELPYLETNIILDLQYTTMLGGDNWQQFHAWLTTVDAGNFQA